MQIQNADEHKAYWETQGGEGRKNLEEVNRKILDAEIAKADFLHAAGNKIDTRPNLKKDITDLFIKKATRMLCKISHDGSEEAKKTEEGFAVWNKYMTSKWKARDEPEENDDGDEDDD